MNFETICNLIIAIAGVIPTVVSLYFLIKNTIKNKNWELVINMIQSAMSTVEKYAVEHPAMKGDDKLNMALEAIKTSCSVAGIVVDEALLKKIVAYISEMCKWTKTVNTK